MHQATGGARPLISFFAGLTALLLTACSNGNYIVLMDGEAGGKTGEISVSNETGTRTLNTAGQALGLEEAQNIPARTIDTATLQADFADVLSAQPEMPRQILLYFQTGSTLLTAESKALIPEVIAEVQRRDAPDIGIIGHSDTQGAADRNARLALKRAKVIEALIIQAGADAGMIEVTSHGEANPLIDTGDGVDEPRNRRVEVVVR